MRQSRVQEVPGTFGLILRPPPNGFDPAISPAQAVGIASQGRKAPGPVYVTLASVPGFFTGVEPYPHKLFMADLLRVTDGRTDPELAELLIGRSYDTTCWMAKQGIEMEPAVSLSAVKVGNTIKWSPGAVIRAKHEGVGLSAMWFKAAERKGVEVRYDTGAVRLFQDKAGRVTGVLVRGPEGFEELSAKAIILGCGGFESNPEWRARYLGRPWDSAKVRGTRYNTGDGLRMAMELGALPHGQWTGCHSTPIDANETSADLEAANFRSFLSPRQRFFHIMTIRS
jgi:succinate dehydrogenase/fumarate reductase flavoprotein subunit